MVLTVFVVDTKGFHVYENLFKSENNCKPSIVKPFHVKSNWKPPVTQSVALESYLDEVTHNTKINLKKADKGTTRVVMDKEDKIKEGQSQLDNTDHYQPLDHFMVVETASKVTSLMLLV